MDTAIKGRIFGIKRFEIHDGQGLRTTVFLQGCPLRCRWCHNPEGLEAKPLLAFHEMKCTRCGRCADVCPAHTVRDGVHTVDRSICRGCGKCTGVCAANALSVYGEEVTAAELLPRLLEDRVFFEAGGGGVTLSGGEPMMQTAFTLELLRMLRREGIHTALDTCGFAPRDAYEKVFPLVDQFLFDVKAYHSDVHERLTGQKNELILSNLLRLNEMGANIEIRVPYVPNMNDGEMEAIAAFLAPLSSVRAVKILGYHDFAADKYTSVGKRFTSTDAVVPSEEETERVRDMFRRAGLKTVI